MSNLPRGIACGVIAGALWGVVFIAPRMLQHFSPLELVIGRYGLYGIFSAALLLPAWRALKHKVMKRDLIMLLRLGLTANILYYLFLATSVHLTGVAPASLIVGMLPVTITLGGRNDHGALRLAKLFLPLLLIAIGIACINLDVFLTVTPDGPAVPEKILGIATATGALFCWTDYAIANTRYLRAHPRFTSREWSLLGGVTTGAMVLCLAPLMLIFPGTHDLAGSRSWGLFLVINLAVALGSSIIGNSFWNAASRYLPLTLSGQMIAFETIFALLYGFLYDWRWPSLLESAAIILLMTGVSWSARLHGKYVVIDNICPVADNNFKN